MWRCFQHRSTKSGIAVSKLKHLLPHTDTRRPVVFSLLQPLACRTSAAQKLPRLIPWVIASVTNNFHTKFTSLSYLSGQTPNREARWYNTDFWLLSTQEVIRDSAERKRVTEGGKKKKAVKRRSSDSECNRYKLVSESGKKKWKGGLLKN